MRTEPHARARSVLNPESLALGISFLLHPFLLVPATLLFLAGRTPGVYLAGGVIIVIFALIAIQVRRGRWTNYDVSVRHQRRGLYWAAVALTAASAAALHMTGASPAIVRGFGATAIMLAAAMLMNRAVKVSMHMMFGAFCAGLAGTAHPRLILVMVAALAALAWSRLRLKRHSPAEVIAGTVAGALTAVALSASALG